jgi:hypothetical protein
LRDGGARRDRTIKRREDGVPASRGLMMTEVQGFVRRWYTVAEVAQMLGFGETKVRTAIIAGDGRQLRPLRATTSSRISDVASSRN